MQSILRACARSGPTLRHIFATLCVALLPAMGWAAPFAYIANYNSSNVSVIDTATNTVTATVTVGTNPYGVSVNPAGTRVYVTNGGTNNVSVIDTATNTVTATVAVGSSPRGVSVNPAGTRVYVANSGSANVSVIDTATNTVTATVVVGSFPYGVSVNPAGTRVYVANNSSDNVSVIDTATNTVTATVPVGIQPRGVSVNPAGTRVYVANIASDNVSVINTATNTVTATVAVGIQPYGVSVNPAGTRVYVVNASSANVSVIDTATNTVTATVAVGSHPRGISVNAAGTRVYVANTSSNTVSVIDTATNTVTATVAVGSGPFNLGNFIGPEPAAPALAAADPIPALCNPPPVAGIGTQPPVLDLASGQGPAMTQCLLVTMRNLLGADTQYLGQTANCVARFSLGGARLVTFYPLQASTFAGQTADIHLTGSNVLNVGTTCGNFNVAPALNSLGDFGAILKDMGMSASISAQGVMTLTVGDKVYVARPNYLLTIGTPTSPSLSQGADGLYRLTDSAGNVQILRPAFLDTDALPSQVQLALSLGGWTVIQTDGTALFTAFNGQQYVLTPDLILTAASQANAAKLLWQDAANHYTFRASTIGLAQGFTIQQR